MHNPNPTILEYLVELKKARTNNDKVKEETMKLLLEKDVTISEVLETLGYPPRIRRTDLAERMTYRTLSTKVRNILRKLWLDGYLDTKKRRYYLKPEIKAQYKALLELINSNSQNPILSLLKEYLPRGENNAQH